MKKESRLTPAISARDLPIDVFYDFSDRGYTAARTRKMIFQALALYGANAYPSIGTLVKKCGVTEQHIRRIMRWLEDNKLLQVQYKKGPQGTNLYTLLFPDAPEHNTATPEHSDGHPNILGGVPEHDHVPQKKERILEREKEEPKHSFSDKKAGQGDKVHEFRQWLAAKYRGLNLTTWQSRKVTTAIVNNPHLSLEDFKQGAGASLYGLDCSNSYDHAGDRLSENLATKAEAAYRRTLEKAKLEEQALQLEAQMKAEAEQRLKEVQEAAIPEEL